MDENNFSKATQEQCKDFWGKICKHPVELEVPRPLLAEVSGQTRRNKEDGNLWRR